MREGERERKKEREGERERKRGREKEREGERERERERERVVCMHAESVGMLVSVPHSVSQSVCMRDYIIYSL